MALYIILHISLSLIGCASISPSLCGSIHSLGIRQGASFRHQDRPWDCSPLLQKVAQGNYLFLICRTHVFVCRTHTKTPGKIVLMYVFEFMYVFECMHSSKPSGRLFWNTAAVSHRQQQNPLSFMDFFVYTYGDEQGDVVVLLLRICLVCK